MSKLLSVTQQNKKRKAISLETKYEIIEKSSKGVKTSELGEQYEKSTSTISTIFNRIFDTTSFDITSVFLSRPNFLLYREFPVDK